jgi:hypothetical protein
MRVITTVATENPEVDGRGDPTRGAAGLFAIVWDTLTEVLGTAAVAAIVRRAVGRAAAESPELVDLVVLRENLEYRYALPRGWSENAEQGRIAFRRLVAEIGRILVELTGTVVIRRLEEIPELCAHQLVWRTAESG